MKLISYHFSIFYNILRVNAIAMQWRYVKQPLDYFPNRIEYSEIISPSYTYNE